MLTEDIALDQMSTPLMSGAEDSLGTDQHGRDVLSRAIYGSCICLGYGENHGIKKGEADDAFRFGHGM